MIGRGVLRRHTPLGQSPIAKILSRVFAPVFGLNVGKARSSAPMRSWLRPQELSARQIVGTVPPSMTYSLP
jgi:hypothetical protein